MMNNILDPYYFWRCRSFLKIAKDLNLFTRLLNLPVKMMAFKNEFVRFTSVLSSISFTAGRDLHMSSNKKKRIN